MPGTSAIKRNLHSEVQPESETEKSPSKDSKQDYTAPDGGWGWMVLLGTMTVNIVVIGHAKSFGVYFKHIIEEFDATPSTVAWLQSLQISIFSFLSPLSSVLSQSYGPRKVAFFGSVLGFLGLTISAFVPTLELLYIFYGVVQGISLTCTFTPGITMIAKYFHRRRGLANGLAMSGNAIGGIFLPLIANKLISIYSLRGCFLIMGSVILHSCVGSLLWQPVEWHQKKSTIPKVPITVQEPENESLRINEYSGANIVCPEEHYIDNTTQDDISISSKDSLTDISPYGSQLELSDAMKVNKPDILIDKKNIATYSSESNLNGRVYPKYASDRLLRGSSSPHLPEVSKPNEKTYVSSVSTESLPTMLGLTQRLQHSRASSFIYLSSYSFGPASGAILTKNHFTSADDSDTSDVPVKASEKTDSAKWRLTHCFKKLAIDKSIFENSRFYLMTVTLFFHAFVYPGTQIFLPYRATTLGFSQEEAASLLSVLALTDLFGRIFCAWISDFELCPRKYWFVGGVFMSGAITYCMPFCTTYLTLVCATAALGFCYGAYIGLVVVMFADAYAPEKVALAYSTSVVSGGFMSLGGPPLMGYILESTGSYLICQIMLGTAQVAASTFWFTEPWLIQWEKKLQAKKKFIDSPEKQQLV